MNQCPQYIFHFDINKTIVISDAAQGLDMYQTINSLLCNICYGKIKENQWVPSCSTVMVDQPQDTSIISYHDYIQQLYPYQTNSPLNSQQKDKRRKFLSSFTDQDQPGFIFKSYQEKLIECMKINSEIDQTKSCQESGQKYFYIIPAFFIFLIELLKQGSHFKIVFRSFGIENQNVSQELEIFCNGKHPLFPLSEQLIHRAQKLFLPIHYAKFYRDHHQTKLHIDLPSSLEFNENSKFLTHYKDIFQYINKTPGSIFLNDYYPYWNQMAESPTAGKLFIVNHNTLHPHKIKWPFQIFFDDNILSNDPHIIDIRDLDYNTIHPPYNYNYLQKVEPYESIINVNYFLKILQQKLQLFSP